MLDKNIMSVVSLVINIQFVSLDNNKNLILLSRSNNVQLYINKSILQERVSNKFTFYYVLFQMDLIIRA